MNHATLSSELQEIHDFMLFALLNIGLSGLFLGLLIGWFLRKRYAVWKWFKNGIYCDKCCPVVEFTKEWDEK